MIRKARHEHEARRRRECDAADVNRDADAQHSARRQRVQVRVHKAHAIHNVRVRSLGNDEQRLASLGRHEPLRRVIDWPHNEWHHERVRELTAGAGAAAK